MPVTMDQLAKMALKIRDKKAEINRKATKEIEDLEVDEKRISTAMLTLLNKTGATSMKTQFGTVYRELDKKPRALDWNAFYGWIAENGAFDALEKRIKKTFIVDYMEANDEETPPGIEVFKEYKVHVRRPSES